MTRYLLDANVFIRAKRDHYRFSVFPCFWDWLLSKHASGIVFSVSAVETEIKAGQDDLTKWCASKLPQGTFIQPDTATSASAKILTAWTSNPSRPYKQSAVNTFFSAADYWLVAHAHAHGFTVVTHETPEPNSRKKVKIPDPCTALGVPWLNPFEMLQREGAAFP